MCKFSYMVWAQYVLSPDVSSHFCMWFLFRRCCNWFCCFCSHVYPHKYNSIVITIPIVYGFFLSIVITIPIVDGFFFYFSTSKFPSCFSQKYKFHSSGYQAEFNPRPLPVFLLLPLSPSLSLSVPSAGLYLPSPRILRF